MAGWQASGCQEGRCDIAPSLLHMHYLLEAHSFFKHTWAGTEEASLAAILGFLVFFGLSTRGAACHLRGLAELNSDLQGGAGDSALRK